MNLQTFVMGLGIGVIAGLIASYFVLKNKNKK